MEILIGGILGIIATLAGILVQHLLSTRKEKAVKKSELKNVIEIVLREIDYNSPRLNGPYVHLDTNGIEVLRIKGLYGELEPDMLNQLLEIYSDYTLINDGIDFRNLTILGWISGGMKGNVTFPGEDIDKIRPRCIERSNKVIKLLRNKLEKQLLARRRAISRG